MNKTVLIIDDDEMLRKTLENGLRDNSFDVLTAGDTDYATQILNRINVDAIILDRMMVGTDGLTFLKNLRANGSRIPVIMLTALAGPENAIDGLSGGADDYLAKPFQLRELILRLNNIIRKNDAAESKMPNGLIFVDNEFFIKSQNDSEPAKILPLSGEEKKLLRNLTNPMGNTAPAAPMVAKRLRNKLNGVLSDIDIITIRGHGYKLINIRPHDEANGDRK